MPYLQGDRKVKFGKPAAISLTVGTILPVLGYLSAGAPGDAENILALVIVIPLWTLAIRGVIFAAQRLNRRADSN